MSQGQGLGFVRSKMWHTKNFILIWFTFPSAFFFDIGYKISVELKMILK